MGLEDVGRLGRFKQDGGRTGGFRQAPGCISMDCGLREPGQFSGRFGEGGDVGTETDESFL